MDLAIACTHRLEAKSLRLDPEALFKLALTFFSNYKL